ncbi:spore maturation protein [Spirulina subsalsa FACHB-351]|uniref:Spore maturation protein n=1 Tax=Spirulina subsalsa FACHB-351 TaxID=234711 RepID=A0ABT3L4M6_9CYAN|nr:spore maturation protein [Spirulina subsalsa]MCW6036468.1 spore maturation protein [Spirulina subsalsa FACHB-351]
MKKSDSPLNGIWLFMILASTCVAALNGTMSELTEAVFESAANAVTLAIGLIGALALWLGIIRVIEVAGLMTVIARLIRPLMLRLFPEVPPEHPAMSAMILNMAANALGLGNAATPIGLKAMTELNRLNQEPGTATNAMCLFLAINTSSVTILPISAIAVRASAGASNPGAIVLPSLIATICSTTVAIIAAKLLAKRSTETIPPSPPPESEANATPEQETSPDTPPLNPPGLSGRLIFGSLIILFFVAIIYRLTVEGTPTLTSTQFMEGISNWLLPMIICSLLLLGYFRGVKVYEAVTEGAKEGFEIAVTIIPFLVAIFVAIGMFRSSGALDMMTTLISPVTNLITLPAEALPMALIRPLSGGGAFGLMSEIVNNDPDSFVSYLVSTMQGSTETTFYVMAVYFGSVGVMRTRHTLPAALLADLTGILASLLICRLTF